MNQSYQATWNDSEDLQQQEANFADAMQAVRTTDWGALADFDDIASEARRLRLTALATPTRLGGRGLTNRHLCAIFRQFTRLDTASAHIIGYFSSFFITGRVVSFVDKILEKTPGIKYIYSTTRDFFEAFAGDKKKFTRNVLANVDDNDVWRFGFVTREDMEDFGLNEYVTVYIPMAYSVAGNVYVIPKNRVRPITNISAAQTMKFAVSGGITDVDDDDSEKKS